MIAHTGALMHRSGYKTTWEDTFCTQRYLLQLFIKLRSAHSHNNHSEEIQCVTNLPSPWWHYPYNSFLPHCGSKFKLSMEFTFRYIILYY